ncbi:MULTISPECIES: DUF3310 domain-containing protein [unclassified Mammaliicoccus]|uniref:DUF3310 domain-containing protein n=1 Tax=unclassified Mammaliicoccus TaxID=2803851 RepID=UPI001EFA9B8D|nr:MULTISPECIES: DUF3310 domain-containing protein [unclassified Mammaliicoccus]
MEFKAGDRIHVTRFCEEKVDFYATISFMGLYNFEINNCSDIEFENKLIAMPDTEFFGLDSEYYYTIATEQEDSEEPVIQRIEHINKAIKESKKYIEQATHDPVNKPSHYMLGDIEVKDIISIVADKYHKGSVAHNVASALEYQMRAPEKNGLEDIKKARKCLDFAIENWE